MPASPNVGFRTPASGLDDLRSAAVALRLLLGGDHRHVERPRQRDQPLQALEQSASCEPRLHVDHDEHAVGVVGQGHRLASSAAGDLRVAASSSSSDDANAMSLGLHHAVVEHHADRPADRTSAAKRLSSSSATAARRRGAPAVPGARPSGSALCSRESSVKPSSTSAAPVSARAAVPRRREERVHARRAAAQPVLPRARCPRTAASGPRRAELALAPLGLVVAMRVAVLVQADARRQRVRERAAQRRRNDGEVERQRGSANGRSARAAARRPSRRRRRGRRPRREQARRRAPSRSNYDEPRETAPRRRPAVRDERRDARRRPPATPRRRPPCAAADHRPRPTPGARPREVAQPRVERAELVWS